MKFEVEYFNRDTQTVHRKLFTSHRLAATIAKRLAVSGCRKVIVRRHRELAYNLWLIDSLTEKMLLIEKGVGEHDAIDWFHDWNKRHQDCICVLAPVGIKMPRKIKTLSKG